MARRLRSRKRRVVSKRNYRDLFSTVLTNLRSPVARKVLQLVLVISVFMSLYFVPSALTVKIVECESQFGNCSRQIEEIVTKSEGKSVRHAKSEITSALSGYSRVREYSIRYLFPNNLRVSCIESTTQFALENSEYETIALLDEDGIVMELVEQSVLPSVVSTEQLPSIGEHVSKDVLFAVSLAKQLRSVYEMAEFSIENDYMMVDGIEDYTVYFPLNGDKDVLLGRLVLILSRLKQSEEEFRIEEDQTVTEVDLRYNNPVLR